MANVLTLEIRGFGFNETAGKLKRVSIRFQDMRPAFEAMEEILERGEERIFEKLRGKYVDTGHLKESLTQSDATDAVREAHAQHLDFGTATWYARFHKDKRGKSPYVKVMTTERQHMSEEAIEYVVGGMKVGV